MQISNDSSVDNFVNSFGHVRQVILDYIRLAGSNFEDFSDVLDLGCGVGRFMFAMRSVITPGQKIYGCDVDADCAAWSTSNIDFAEIHQSALDPPLRYSDGCFDFIYALSVFTHLSLDLQFTWAWELHRLLRPGGLMFITTSGPGFLLRAMEAGPDYFPVRSMNVFGENATLAVFATEDSRAIEGQREVAATHSNEAVRSIFSAFDLVCQIPISRMAGGQTVNLLRRRQGRISTPAGSCRADMIFIAEDDRSPAAVFELPSGENGVIKLALQFAATHYSGDRLRLKFEVISEGADFFNGDVQMPFNTAFGKGHFIELECLFPARNGPVRISCWLEALAPGVFTGDAPFSIEFVRSEPLSS